MRACARFRLAALGLAVLAALAALPAAVAPRPAAAQLPSADLALLRLTGPQGAQPGREVTVRILATNLGPAASELDAIVSTTGGLELAGMACDRGVSPDTPACEYSNVAPGTRLTTRATFRVLAGAGPTETVTACTGSEGLTEDPTPGNDCATLAVAIVGG
jgi:hypothetical protein